MKTNNTVKNKSYKFAIKIINLFKKLRVNKEYILSKKILRSGTSIGANIRESEQAESKADFIHKLAIAFKEANETEYWLELLKETEFINNQQFYIISKDCKEILRLLTSIIKTTRNGNN